MTDTYSDSSLFEFKIHCNLYPYWLPVKISRVTAWVLSHILWFLARYMVAQIQIAFYTPSYILGWSCIRLLSGGIEMIWYHCPLVEGVEPSPGPCLPARYQTLPAQVRYLKWHRTIGWIYICWYGGSSKGEAPARW